MVDGGVVAEQTRKARDALAEHLTRAPILSRLPRPDLARLAVDAREKSYSAGEQVFAEGDAAAQLYLILAGEIEISSGARFTETVRQGFLGEESVLGHEGYVNQARSVSPKTRLLVLDGLAVAEILAGHPRCREDFSLSLLRFGRKEQDALPYPPQGESPVAAESPSKEPGTAVFIGWLLALLLPVALYHLPGLDGFSANSRIFISVFATTILMWVFRLVPDFVAGLLSVLVVLVLGIAPGEVILGGFQSSSFFMAMSIFVLAGVVVASGLVYRLSLILLKRTPPSKFLYNLVLTLAALATTPILPSANGRIGLLSPLLADVIGVLGYRRQGPDANRLAVSVFFGTSLFSAVFLTSKSINFLVFGMLPSQVQDGFHWLNWTLHAAVAALVSLSLLLLLSSLAFRSGERPRLSPVQVQTQLDILGPMSRAEWGAVAGVALLMAGIATTSLHKIQPAWIALALMFLFLAIGTMDKEDFRRKIDWPFLFLLGTLIGLAKTISFLGIDREIGDHLFVLGELMKENLYLFVLALAGLIFLLRFAVSINATVVIMVPILLPLAEAAGINAWVVCFMILTSSEAFFLPYQCSYYMLFRGFNERQKLYLEPSFLHVNLWSILIRMLAIYASIPFWRALEILQ